MGRQIELVNLDTHSELRASTAKGSQLLFQLRNGQPSQSLAFVNLDYATTERHSFVHPK